MGEYKETEIGKMPVEWKIENIQNICIIGRGRVISKKEIDENHGIYPVFSSQTINNGCMGKINSYDFEGEYTTWTTDGIYAGKTFYRKGKFNCTNVCGVLSPKDKNQISMKFLGNILSKYTEKYVVRNGNPKLMNNVMGIVKFPLPPIEEQKKIANILSNVYENIETVEDLIIKTKELKKGLMQELLTKGIGHIEYKDTEIGQIPNEWNIKDLKNILEICYGKSQKEIECINGKYDILGTGGVIGKTNNYLWNKPSVLIGRKGTIDKPRYIDVPFWTVDTLFYTKIRDEYNVKFLFYNICSVDLKKLNEATGVPSLSTNTLYKVKIAIPPIEEQEKIANILSSVDNQIEEYEKKKEKLEELKKGLMQKLLTGQIRVKV